MSDYSAIQHILDHCITIEEYMAESDCKSQEDFIAQKMLHDAVLMHLLDIGELIKSHISRNFINQHQGEVDWQGAMGLRNIAAHRYNTVKFTMIWDVVSNELPGIKHFCEQQIQISQASSDEDESDENSFEP